MALEISYTSKMGFNANTAYCRITNVTIQRSGEEDLSVSATIQVFYDVDAADKNDAPIGYIGADLHLPMTESTSLSGLYLWLKANHESFIESMDV